MSGSFKSKGVSVHDLIHCAGAGHLAEVAPYAVGIALHERASRRVDENESDGSEGAPWVDEDADAALALAVLDGERAEPEVAVLPNQRAFVRELFTIKRIAAAYRTGLLARRLLRA